MEIVQKWCIYVTLCLGLLQLITKALLLDQSEYCCKNTTLVMSQGLEGVTVCFHLFLYNGHEIDQGNQVVTNSAQMFFFCFSNECGLSLGKANVFLLFFKRGWLPPQPNRPLHNPEGPTAVLLPLSIPMMHWTHKKSLVLYLCLYPSVWPMHLVHTSCCSPMRLVHSLCLSVVCPMWHYVALLHNYHYWHVSCGPD